jgi:hypothetical protein
MQADLNELETLAKWNKDTGAWMHVTPEVILSLIRRIRELEGQGRAAKPDKED